MSKYESVSRQAGKRRWTILLGGFLLSLVGGMSYAWGSFVVPLVNDWGWTAAEATLPLTVLIIVFALTMIPAGWLQDKFGPRKTATVGAVLFLVGYSLAGLLRYIRSHTWLILTYGIVVGLACGLTYACIAPTARKWFTDRPGFAVSTSVMGFGLAAVLLAPLKKLMINAMGVDGTLFVLGGFAFAAAIVGASLLKNPPDDWTPPQRAESKIRIRPPMLKKTPEVTSSVTPRVTPNVISEVTPRVTPNVTPREFIRTPIFYGLWLALAAVIGGGLTAIGLLSAFGELELGLSPTQATLAVSLFSLVNGLGRPFAGALADRIGTMRVMMIVYILQSVVFLTFPWVATNYPLLLLCSIFLGAGYAVTFALFPVVVAARFGTRHLGVNYGLVFSAFGMGAVTSFLGTTLLDTTGSFTPAFLLAGITTAVGLILLIALRKKLTIQ